MDDSFFGFDTTTGIPDDDGQIAEPPEEEYDALNDETFGSAINGDWEEAHETLVRLGGNGEKVRRGADFTDHNQSGSGSSSGNGAFYNQNNQQQQAMHLRGIQAQAGNIDDSDLEINLSTMKLDDVDLSTFGESDGNNRFNWDSVVWGSKAVPMPSNQQLFRDNFRSAFKPQPQTTAAAIGPSARPLQESNANFGLPPMPPTSSAKISTLEDIERNLIIQQAIPKPQQQTQQPLHQQDFNLTNRQHAVVTPTIPQHQQQLQKPPPPHKAPPGFMTAPQTPPPRPNLGFHGPHPLAGTGPVPGLMPTPQQQPQQHQQLNGLSGNRVPPGFIYPTGLAPNLPQHPLLPQHAALPPSFQRALPNPHLPTALNNFAMHPSFNAMRVGMHPAAFMQPVPPPRLPPHNLLNQQPNSMYNMFNMRLVQEIQQNHPLLQNAAVARQQQQQGRVGVGVGDRQKQQQLPPQMQQQLHQQQLQLQHQQQQQQQQQHNRHGGNLPHEEFDEYANLMSTRDKHWLIGIQLSQLNTDTPYIDDYYYTVHKERKNGQVRHSQAHKDNQLNHPLTQPRGHAQLILVQLGNKNGSRNGQQHRERRNSENTTSSNASGTTNSGNNTNALPGYMFSPLKFENSLGKLQYGSVTAPRKIIDADIMGSDMGPVDNNALSSASGAGSQNADKSIDGPSEVILAPSNMRKSRHILLHIETLYRYLLKLEDLESPEVMSTILLKKKKESERIAALEQMEMAHKTPEERAAEANNPQAMNPALKNKFNYEIEARPVLVAKLKSGLTFNKVVSMMSVRKGKILLRRIMPFIADQSIRWAVWTGVFCSLQTVVKKDREDVEGVLYALYPEFKKHIHEANFETIINISAAFTLNDKKMLGIFCSRFGILSLVGLILRAEAIYMANNDSTLSEDNRQKWREFLAQVASCLNRTIQNQTISAAIESDAIQPMMNHFARFKDLKLDALLALITEAKHQIN